MATIRDSQGVAVVADAGSSEVLHPSHRTSSSPRRRARRARIIVRFVRLVLVAGLGIAGWDLVPKTNHREARETKGTDETLVGPAIRLEYPLSLIPGGLTSDAELEAARTADPILAEHYADVGFLRTAFIPRDQWLYASYRQGHSIFWTNSRILVRATELVLADRSGNLVRGRCGNRLSDTPRTPVAFVQPPEAISETPEVSFMEAPSPPQSSLADLPAVLFPPFPPLEAPESGRGIRSVPTTVAVEPGWQAAGPFDSGLFPVGPISKPARSKSAPSPPGSVETPEPDSAWLLVAGCIIIVVCRWRARI
jgi:hypothetical protein